MSLYLTLETDAEQDHGVRVDITTEPRAEEKAVQLQKLNQWGGSVAEFADVLYQEPGSSPIITALMVAIAQNAFNAGVVHGNHSQHADLIGVAI